MSYTDELPAEAEDIEVELELDDERIRRLRLAYKDMTEVERFLHLKYLGYGDLESATEVGWSRHELRQHMKNPEFAEAVSEVEQRIDESVERTILRKARAGNTEMLKLWAFNRMPGRWRDVRRIEVESKHTVEIGTTQAIAAAALEALRQGGIAALQPATDVIDAEVVSDTDDGD